MFLYIELKQGNEKKKDENKKFIVRDCKNKLFYVSIDHSDIRQKIILRVE